MKKKIFFCFSLMSIMVFLLGLSVGTDSKRGKSSTLANDVVNVYGPGGPLGPIKEMAEQFTKDTGIKVEVTAGPEANWIDQAKQDADIIYGGSEYMLTDFMLKYPGIINEKKRTELYPRAVGILVRKGNPKKIHSLEDLTKSGVKIVDVNGAGQLGLWEDLAGRKGLIPGISKNITISVKSSADAIDLWKANSKYDAWITYESWHYRLNDVTELIQLPEEDKLYRGTPISLTNRSDNKKEAKQFIAYLKTEKSHHVFQKWGWK
ncbi:extracellular solute-binding protein [Lederbergia citrea]|uniref:Extracellular solute-binding protein n=1 Tax=Lederbergia citrea TaxID=2833581 RepID=A0A942UU69_9BACI|nr:extracellular solute-binding protein [Lederbergia citrea]MBS4178482.1 extracellular solute-binding protein [Lederbergia citrea]MBS4205154.1 extracellular solute-binding protein [Lederbergia citrea]MBS4222984.1 extracellular solute-binding protein [Lederbergia citrea]